MEFVGHTDRIDFILVINELETTITLMFLCNHTGEMEIGIPEGTPCFPFISSDFSVFQSFFITFDVDQIFLAYVDLDTL